MKKEIYVYETKEFVSLPALESGVENFDEYDLLDTCPSDFDEYTDGEPYPIDTRCMFAKDFAWWCRAIEAQNELYGTLHMAWAAIKANVASIDYPDSESLMTAYKETDSLLASLDEFTSCSDLCDVVSRYDVCEFLIEHGVAPEFVKYSATERD